MAFRPPSSGSQRICVDDHFFVRSISPSQAVKSTKVVTNRHVREEKVRKEVDHTTGEQSRSGSKSTSSHLEETSFARRFPSVRLVEHSDSRTLPALAEHLEEEIRRHKKTYTFLQEKERIFTERLNGLISQNSAFKQENNVLRARLQKERQTIEQLEAQLQQRKQEVQRKVSHRAVSPVTVEEYVDLGRRLRRGDRDEHVEKKASRTSHRDGRARRLNDKSSREEVLDYVDGHRKELEKLQSKSRSHSDVEHHLKKLAKDLDRKNSTIDQLRVLLGDLDNSSVSTVTPTAPVRSSESFASSSPRQQQQRLVEHREERIDHEAQQSRKTERRSRNRPEGSRSRDEASQAAQSERFAAKFSNSLGNRPSSPCKPFHNPRYGSVIVARRSSRERSLDRVLEHRSKHRVPMGTILRPRRHVFRTVSTKKLDLEATMHADKYVLEHQDADDVGNVQTHLFKGDIIPTSGGGRAVIFKDVETLQHKNPLSATTSHRKLVSANSTPSGNASRFCCERC